MQVLVHREVDVPSETLEGAQRFVSKVFDEMSVTVTWMEEAEFVGSMPIYPAERRAFVSRILQLRLISRARHKAMGLPKQALGMAVASARFAWISFDRVLDSARRARIDPGEALGYVMAHELGHLLLPVHSHSVNGLMREDLDPLLITLNRFHFLDEEAAYIRTTLQNQINKGKSGRDR